MLPGRPWEALPPDSLALHIDRSDLPSRLLLSPSLPHHQRQTGYKKPGRAAEKDHEGPGQLEGKGNQEIQDNRFSFGPFLLKVLTNNFTEQETKKETIFKFHRRKMTSITSHR